MITIDILPNAKLKETLSGKFAPFLIATSQIPVYWIDDEKDFFEKIVKKGDSKAVADEILAKLRSSHLLYKKEYLHYFKHHLEKHEALQVGFTLYLFDKNKDEYFGVQKIIKEISMDKGFFKMIEKPIKRTRWRIAFEAIIHEIVFDMAKVTLSEKYDVISLKEWQREYKV